MTTGKEEVRSTCVCIRRGITSRPLSRLSSIAYFAATASPRDSANQRECHALRDGYRLRSFVNERGMAGMLWYQLVQYDVIEMNASP
jgi:hypothetical protein